MYSTNISKNIICLCTLLKHGRLHDFHGGGGRKRLLAGTHITSAKHGPLRPAWPGSGFLMLSPAIWALSLSILVQNGINQSRSNFKGVPPPPPPPHNAFSEFCRYIWKFVGTCKPTNMSFVPAKYKKYTNQILKEIPVFECENVKLFKLTHCARSHLHVFSQC